jgi:hypothetical protein
VREVARHYAREGNHKQAARARKEMDKMLKDPNHQLPSSILAIRQKKFKDTHKRKKQKKGKKSD